MKKISACIIAIIIFLIIIINYNLSMTKQIAQNQSKLYYLLDDIKFNNIEAVKTCLKDKDDVVLVLGSSELGTFNTTIFNNGNSNFNMYLVGRGSTQSLQSAISLGAIEEETNIKKVVLILSPQWFEGEQPNMSSEIFSSRFQKSIFKCFMKNKKISNETKQKVINLLKTLEVTDELELEKIERYEKAYLQFDIAERISLSIEDSLDDTKQNKKLIELLKGRSDNNNSKTVKFEDYNFEQLLEEARIQGERSCTNNQFKIYNSYYNTYIESILEEIKGTKTEVDFKNEYEYEYLQLFLEICNQLEIQPLIVNVPVNGRWYDYVGISREKREAYYTRINKLVSANNAKIADFSDCEYEEYFLKDIMHLGWKGWIKVDEAVYKYYKEK